MGSLSNRVDGIESRLSNKLLLGLFFFLTNKVEILNNMVLEQGILTITIALRLRTLNLLWIPSIGPLVMVGWSKVLEI